MFESILADLKATLAELESAVAPTKGCAMVEGQGWIVLDPYGQAMKFDTTGKLATVTGKVLPHRANRWDRGAAQSIADQLGECTIAHWKSATAAKVKEMQKLVSDIESRI